MMFIHKCSLVLVVMNMMIALTVASAIAAYCYTTVGVASSRRHGWLHLHRHEQSPRRRLPPRRRLLTFRMVALSTTQPLPNEIQQSGRRNNIMEDVILSRFDRSVAKNDDWSKTRNYLYRNSDRLSVQQVEQVLRFLETVFHNDQDLVRSILQSSPRILRRNVTSNLQPTVKFLQKLYGPQMFREAISRNPDLLVASGLGYNCNDDSVESFLYNQLKLSTSSITKLKKSHPFVFQLPLEKIESVVHFLERKLQEAGYPNEDLRRTVGKVVTSHPHLLNLSVSTNLQPRIDFLIQTCGLADKDVATLIKSSPGILGLSVEDNLRPTLEFLSKLLSSTTASAHITTTGGETTTTQLRKCIMNHPQIMGLSLKNLQSKVAYFDAIDALSCEHRRASSDISLAARIATKSPAVFSLSLKDNIIPTVEFLAHMWGTPAPTRTQQWDGSSSNLTIPMEESPATTRQRKTTVPFLSNLLNEYPSILTLSLEGNIQPTLNFYNRTGYIALDKDWSVQPALRTTTVDHSGVNRIHVLRGREIAASLFNRLLPRWHFCTLKQQQQQGMSSSEEESYDVNVVLKLPPLHLLVAATDPKFCKQMGFDLQEYTMFKASSVSRLKFAAQFDTWLHTGRQIDV